MTARTTDIDAVLATLQRYVDGTYRGDVKLLASSFHPQALMTGYLGGQFLVGSPQPFLDHVGSVPSPQSTGAPYTGRFAAVEVTGSTATARLVEDNLYGLDFVDDFHLVKTPAGEWLIVSKLFHHD